MSGSYAIDDATDEDSQVTSRHETDVDVTQEDELQVIPRNATW